MKDDHDKDDDKQVAAAKEIINRYRTTYKHISPDVLFNLSALKNASTKTENNSNLDATAEEIRTHLGAEESGATLREERWHGKVICPFCNAKHIKRLPIEQQTSHENHKYLCLDCKQNFSDDTDTKIESGVPPLHTWMFCWYLLGTSTSIQYIASKLGLSTATVEMMIQHMQRLFKSNEPMQHFMSFDEWSLKVGKSYKVALQEAMSKQVERFRGFSLGQESDTAEVRRQKHRSSPKPK